MKISDILSFSCTKIFVQENSKKRVLELSANLITQYSSIIDSRKLFSLLFAREKLGSTAIEGGIAFPHCQISYCKKPIAAFLRLGKPIDFNADDHKPVDLFFVLVVPLGDRAVYLNLLQNIIDHYNDKILLQKLREINDTKEFYATLTEEFVEL